LINDAAAVVVVMDAMVNARGSRPRATPDKVPVRESPVSMRKHFAENLWRKREN
jgi:hypothetical protein